MSFCMLTVEIISVRPCHTSHSWLPEALGTPVMDPQPMHERSKRIVRGIDDYEFLRCLDSPIPMRRMDSGNRKTNLNISKARDSKPV